MSGQLSDAQLDALRRSPDDVKVIAADSGGQKESLLVIYRSLDFPIKFLQAHNQMDTMVSVVVPTLAERAVQNPPGNQNKSSSPPTKSRESAEWKAFFLERAVSGRPQALACLGARCLALSAGVAEVVLLMPASGRVFFWRGQMQAQSQLVELINASSPLASCNVRELLLHDPCTMTGILVLNQSATNAAGQTTTVGVSHARDKWGIVLAEAVGDSDDAVSARANAQTVVNLLTFDAARSMEAQRRAASMDRDQDI